jgi:hypothetical protein
MMNSPPSDSQRPALPTCGRAATFLTHSYPQYNLNSNWKTATANQEVTEPCPIGLKTSHLNWQIEQAAAVRKPIP